LTISEDKEDATVSAAGNVTAQEPATDQQEGATTKPAATEMHTNASELSSLTTAGPGKPQDASEVAASSADETVGHTSTGRDTEKVALQSVADNSSTV